MWLSEKIAAREMPDREAESGVVSVGGESPAVVVDGEKRQLTVVSPGGYRWQPGVEQEVLVLGERVLGTPISAPELKPGEVCIFSRGASIRLANDGSIYLEGTVYINGERWEACGCGTG